MAKRIYVKGLITKVCKKCGKDFQVYSYLAKKRIFCGNSCANSSKPAWNKGLTISDPRVKRLGKKQSRLLKERYASGEKVMWNKGRKLTDYPQMGFQKGHIVFGGERTRFEKGIVPANAFKKGHITWSKGKKRPEITGEGNPIWKGDDVGYYALHSWVERNLGQPDTCEHCGKSGLKGRQIHWANKSQEYRRNVSDWLRLCAKCHKTYDNKKGKQIKSYIRASYQ